MLDQSRNVGHAARVENLVRGMAVLLGIGTVFGVVVGLVLGSWAWLLLGACVAGWVTLGGFYLLHQVVIERAGNAIGRILVPSGGSTPSVAQHSNIEAMEARGRYAEAAEAYQAVIATDPADLVACEKLGQLALRELKDFNLAVFAYREAEKRATEPKRQLGYGLLVAGIYRDNLKDLGKAVVELRRVLARHPDAPNAAALKAEIEELKAHLFEAP